MIEIKNITFSHKNKRVISDLSLTASPKKPIVISGKNGSGKTTLLKLCAKRLSPQKGSITYSNQTEKSIAFVPVRTNGFFPLLTGLENIHFFENLLKIDLKERIERWSRIDTFKKATNQSFQTCSIGMKQALNIFTLTAHRPKYIFLDEAFGHFDSITRDQIAHTLTEEFQDSTFIMSKHTKDFVWPTSFEEIDSSLWE